MVPGVDVNGDQHLAGRTADRIRAEAVDIRIAQNPDFGLLIRRQVVGGHRDPFAGAHDVPRQRQAWRLGDQVGSGRRQQQENQQNGANDEGEPPSGAP